MDTENKYGTLEVQKGLLELIKEFHAFCIKCLKEASGNRYKVNNPRVLLPQR
jgi:hypothetical protein